MYESHFGFRGAPFSLNPDPAFFFGSRGHTSALSYLKFGVYQGEGFVVVTGDIGAGKTTLVHTLLSGLDRERIVAAQIVSTQLEAGDLLRSVALSFGVGSKGLSKAELIATIEAFLTSLVSENRRALLIVDEAQNLSREAVEELRMLSNFQLGNHALLQSFLVGQPELRNLLTSKPMEQFRQRVIASCHLGPMDCAETRTYIEHRMHQVGWDGRRLFDDEAYLRIHRWTGGIPRRVNLLCNRLLLSAFLASQPLIDASAVDAVAEEMRGEVTASPVRIATGAETTQDAEPEATLGPVVFVASNASDELKIAALLKALERHPEFPALRVRLGDASRFAGNNAWLRRMTPDVPLIELDLNDASPTQQIAEALCRVEPIVDMRRPAVMVVVGDDDGALACSLVARKKGCRLAHVDAGRRGVGSDGVNSALIDRIADVFYTSEMTAYLNLIREGVREADIEHAGQLPDEQAARKIAAHLSAWLAGRTGHAGHMADGSARPRVVPQRP